MKALRRVFLIAPGPFGGAEKIVLEGALRLKSQVWIIKELRNPAPAIDFERRCRERHLNTKVFDCASRFDFSTLKRLRAAIGEEQIELVHSHGLKANIYCSLLSGKKVATQHGQTSHDAKTRLFERLESLALHRMDALICVSDQAREAKRKRAQLVENFLVAPGMKALYRDCGELELLFLGRIAPEKGLRDLLIAMRELPATRLTVVGDGPEREACQQDFPLANVRYAGFQKDIAPFLKRADALIMPSRSEAMPLSALEAAAAGLPILASKVGALPQIVQDQRLMFSPEDSAGIVRTIKEFNRERAQYNRLAKAFALRARETYSIDQWAQKTEKIYEQALSN